MVTPPPPNHATAGLPAGTVGAEPPAAGGGEVLSAHQLRAMLEHLSRYWQRGKECPLDEWARVRAQILATVQ